MASATPPPESPVVARQTRPEPVPEVTQTPTLPAPETPATADLSKVSLQLQATEKTWVSLSAGGKTLFAGILDASERKDLDGLENAKLVTGNAAGLDVRWNGKPLGPLGPRGQVRTIIFTPDKYEVVQPVPKKTVTPGVPDPRPTGVG